MKLNKKKVIADIHNAYDWLKYKIDNWRFYLPQTIKHYKFNLKVYCNFFSLPEVIRSYKFITVHALEGLKYSREDTDSRNKTIEYLLEQLVEAKLGGEDADYTKEQEREAYRSVYLDDAIREITYDDNMPVFELPSEYMTEDEEDDAFDRDYEHHRCVMEHCYDDYEDQIQYELDNGPLKKGGWYEEGKRI